MQQAKNRRSPTRKIRFRHEQPTLVAILGIERSRQMLVWPEMSMGWANRSRITFRITESPEMIRHSNAALSATSVHPFVIRRSGVGLGQNMIAEATIQSIQVTSSTGKYPHLTRSMSVSGMFAPRRTIITRVRIQNAMDAIATRLNTNPPSSSSADSINNGTC